MEKRVEFAGLKPQAPILVAGVGTAEAQLATARPGAGMSTGGPAGNFREARDAPAGGSGHAR